MKKNLTHLIQSQLKTKVITMAIGMVIVSVGCINNTSYVSNTSNTNKYIQVLGTAAKTPVVVYKSQTGVATGEGISIRKGPGTQYSWQGSFHFGTKINILGTSGSFYKVSYNGVTGYVSKQYVKIVVPVIVAKPVVYPLIYKTQYGITKSATSIRIGSSTANSIQGTFAKGTNIIILASQSSWYKVSYSGKTGYVSNSTVTLTAKPVSVVTPVQVIGINLNKTTDTLSVGGSDTLKATIAPTNATNKAVKWTSSNIHVAKVNSSGKVTALAVGYANITATSIDGKKINHCTVTVKTPTLTTKSIYQNMIDLKGKYPEGMPWTNDNYYRWNGGIYSAGYGCAGFAFLLSDAAFGKLPAREHDDFGNIRVGDIVRINNDTHSVIVLSINNTGITVAEGNYNSSIHWGRMFTLKQMAKVGNYIMTRYPQ